MASSGDRSEGLVLAVPPELLDELVERVVHRLGASGDCDVERWVGVQTVAQHLGCGRQRIYDLVSRRERNRIPYRKDGTRLLFRLSEVDAWLSQGRL